MPILFLSEGAPVRPQVKAALGALRSRKSSLSVLDIGAAANPWLGDLLTDALDFFGVDRGGLEIRSHVGDVNKSDSFAQFADKQFDFVVCTHTLEDVREPEVAIREMQRIAKAGFVSVPNRHTELSNLRKFRPFGKPWARGGFHLGFAHHRWVFHVRNSQKLEAVAKWSGISGSQSWYESLVKAVVNFPLFPFGKQSVFERLGVRLHGDYPWIDPNLVGLPDVAELSLVWADSFDFGYYNNDYCGSDDGDMVRLFSEFVSSDVALTPCGIEEAMAAVSRRILGG
jgi:SAM-dependent methyltransferase